LHFLGFLVTRFGLLCLLHRICYRIPAVPPLVVGPQLPSHLTSLRGAFTGLGVPFEEDEEAVDTPMAMGLPDPKAPAAAAGGAAAGMLAGARLGINMPAKAVPMVGPLGASGGGKGVSGSGAAAAAAAAALDHRLGPEEVVLCFGIIDILQVEGYIHVFCCSWL
jgi:hypothetical protein